GPPRPHILRAPRTAPIRSAVPAESATGPPGASGDTPTAQIPMNTRRVLPLVALGLALAAIPAAAQSAPCHFICSPRFTFQPGVIVKNAINPPATPSGDAPSASDFLFRVVTVAPTTIPRTALSFALQWTPFADRNGFTSNAPGFTYGP